MKLINYQNKYIFLKNKYIEQVFSVSQIGEIYYGKVIKKITEGYIIQMDKNMYGFLPSYLSVYSWQCNNYVWVEIRRLQKNNKYYFLTNKVNFLWYKDDQFTIWQPYSINKITGPLFSWVYNLSGYLKTHKSSDPIYANHCIGLIHKNKIIDQIIYQEKIKNPYIINIEKSNQEFDIFINKWIYNEKKKTIHLNMGYIIIENTDTCLNVDINRGNNSQNASNLDINLDALQVIYKFLYYNHWGGIIFVDLLDSEKNPVINKVHELFKHDKYTLEYINSLQVIIISREYK